MSKFKTDLILFYNFLKIGAFTFGGGLAMIPLVSRIVVEKYHWMTDDEMVDMIAIAESTPGVIAVNLATFIGFKLNKFFGALFATLGVILPSFLIITLISFFYEKFIEIEVVSWAFMGIKACVAILILNAGIKLLKNVKKNVFSVLVLLIAFMLCLFVNAISTVYIIIGGLVVGVLYYTIAESIRKKKDKKDDSSNEEVEEQTGE